MILINISNAALENVDVYRLTLTSAFGEQKEETSFTLIITCTITPISIAQFTTVEISDTVQPYDITFTQTQDCGVKPTLNLSAEWLSIFESNVRLTGA